MNAPLAPPVKTGDYYELRLYQMRPGRMPAFHDLMENVALPAFARSGIPRPLAMWQGHSGPLAPLYAYLLHWDDLDARMQAWKAFYADPGWVNGLRASYGDQQRVERTHVFILRSAPIRDRFRGASGPGPVGGVHELRIHDILNNDPTPSWQALAETDLPFQQARGGQVLGVFATWFGTRMNQAITLTAWPDATTAVEAARAHQTDPGILAVRDAERRAHGRPLLRGTDVHLLQPLPYGPALANLAAG